MAWYYTKSAQTESNHVDDRVLSHYHSTTRAEQRFAFMIAIVYFSPLLGVLEEGQNNSLLACTGTSFSFIEKDNDMENPKMN